jgi:hypothetical protein
VFNLPELTFRSPRGLEVNCCKRHFSQFLSKGGLPITETSLNQGRYFIKF